MENLSETPNTPGVSDVNRSDFYKDINNHNESMKAHLQKILQVIYTSRGKYVLLYYNVVVVQK